MATAQSDDSFILLVRHFKEADEFYIAHSLPSVLGLVGAYLLFVLKLGPAFMKNREPYKLKNAILLYNAFQVLLSAFLIPFTWNITKQSFTNECTEDTPEGLKDMLFKINVYFFCKMSELVDTIFFVLRKKYNQVTFLHVYHHASVVIGTWIMFMYSPNQSAIFAGFVNAIVHVLMYSYYFLAALGPRYQKYLAPWKKPITSLQLVQFIIVILHQLYSLFIKPCRNTVVGVAYVIFSCVVFYILFKDFFTKSYEKPKAKENGTANKKE